jgi:hypothetical protein
MAFWKRSAQIVHRLFTRLTRRRPRPAPVPHVEVVVYTRSNCPLCDKVGPVLQRLQHYWHYRLRWVAIDGDAALTAEHGQRVPVVTVQGKVRFWGAVNPVLLERLLVAEARRRPVE